MKTILRKINRKTFLMLAMALVGTGAFSQAIPTGPTENCNSVDIPLPTVSVGTAPTAQCPGTTINLAGYASTDPGNTLKYYYDAGTTYQLPSSSVLVSATRTYYVTATNDCGDVSAAASIPVTAKSDCANLTTCTVIQACKEIDFTAPALTNATGYTGSWEIETTAFSDTYTELTLPYYVQLADDGKRVRYKLTDGGSNTYYSPNVVVLGVEPGSGSGPAQPSAITLHNGISVPITDGSTNVDFSVEKEDGVTYTWEAVSYTLSTEGYATVHTNVTGWFTILKVFEAGDPEYVAGRYKIRTKIDSQGVADGDDIKLTIRVTPSNGCGTGQARELTFDVKKGF